MTLRPPQWLLKLLPVTVVTRRYNNQIEPAALAHTLDADGLAEILRASEFGNMGQLFSLYRDIITGHTHTQTEFQKRKLAVVGDEVVFEPPDRKNAAQKQVSDEIEAQCTGLPNWLDVLLFALDSCLYPVTLIEKTYRPSTRPGVRYELASLTPVPYRLLDYTDGVLKIWDTDERGNILGTRNEPDPMRYIVHRGHGLVGMPDTWGGPMRAVTFWYFFSVNDRAWWARFLDRFGAPFLQASYDESDDDAKYTLANAFAAATRLFGIAVPKNVELKMQQASMQGADAFKIFHEIANDEISKCIIGQTMSSTAKATGLNSSQGDIQEEVRQDYRQFDAKRLSHTLRTQLFQPLCSLNGWPGQAPIVTWGGESAGNMKITSEVLTSLPNAGLEITDEGIDILSRRLNLPLRRAPATAAPGPGLPLSVDWLPPGRNVPARTRRLREANAEIAAHGAEQFALAMSDSLAPIRHILSLSVSQEDFERRLREEFPALPSRHAAAILAACMISNSANAVLAFPDIPAQS